MTTARTLYVERERTVWSKGRDGVWETIKHKDETLDYSVDFTDHPAIRQQSETVSSVAEDASGVTVSGGSLSSGVYSFTVADTDGTLELLATTSGGQVIREFMRFISPEEQMYKGRDYGNPL